MSCSEPIRSGFDIYFQISKDPPSLRLRWPVGKSVDHSPECVLMWEGPNPLWAVLSLGRWSWVVFETKLNKGKQVSKQHSSVVPTSAPASASLANGLCLRYVNQINSFLLSWFWSVLSQRRKETKEIGTGEKRFYGFWRGLWMPLGLWKNC